MERRYTTLYVESSTLITKLKNILRKERAMSRIKDFAEKQLGEDWVHKLEDMEKENGKRRK